MMKIEIGREYTELVLGVEGNIPFRNRLQIGTETFDDAIINHMKTAHLLMIGEPTAEEIRNRIGCAVPMEPELRMEVRGRELIAGLPKSLTVTSAEIREALLEPISAIDAFIRAGLDECPPDLSQRIAAKGILLVPTNCLRGLDNHISAKTGLRVRT